MAWMTSLHDVPGPRERGHDRHVVHSTSRSTCRAALPCLFLLKFLCLVLLLKMSSTAAAVEYRDEAERIFFAPIENAKDVRDVPDVMSNIVHLAAHIHDDPDKRKEYAGLGRNDPMLPREVARDLGLKGRDGANPGGKPTKGSRSDMARARANAAADAAAAASALGVVLDESFDPGQPERWERVAGGAVSEACGAVSGEALCFTGSGMRFASTTPMDLRSGALISYDVKAVGAGDGAVVLEASTGDGDWVELKRHLPSPGESGAEFVAQDVELPESLRSAVAKLRWRQLADVGVNDGAGTADGDGETNVSYWAIDDVSVVRPAAAGKVRCELTRVDGVDATHTGRDGTAVRFAARYVGGAVKSFDRDKLVITGGLLAGVQEGKARGVDGGDGLEESVFMFEVQPLGVDDVTLAIRAGAATAVADSSATQACMSLAVPYGDGVGSVHVGTMTRAELEDHVGALKARIAKLERRLGACGCEGDDDDDDDNEAAEV